MAGRPADDSAERQRRLRHGHVPEHRASPVAPAARLRRAAAAAPRTHYYPAARRRHAGHQLRARVGARRRCARRRRLRNGVSGRCGAAPVPAPGGDGCAAGADGVDDGGVCVRDAELLQRTRWEVIVFSLIPHRGNDSDVLFAFLHLRCYNL